MHLSLPELVVAARHIDPPAGTLDGTCVFCAKHTAHGHPAEFPDSFCNASLLSSGDVICPACQHMQIAEIPGTDIAGKFYRVNMWYASADDGFGLIRFPKKEGAENQARELDFPIRTPRDVLCDPPAAPFAIYLTRTWKKTGWQSMLRANGGVSYSRENFIVGFDYDIIHIDLEKLKKDLAFIDQYRIGKKPTLSKYELEAGQIGVGGMAKLIDAGIDVMPVMDFLKKRASDPAWGLAVYVA